MTAIYGTRWTSAYGEQAGVDGVLSEAAQTWAEGLAGLSRAALVAGFTGLMVSGLAWPPSLPEFRELCASGGEVPTLDQVVRLLARSAYLDGSMVERYGHPLALAVALEVDMHGFRCASMVQALAMVRPVYRRLLIQGYAGWPPGAMDTRVALPPVPVDYAAAKERLAQARAAAGV